jgi:hypothetical protein
MKKRLAGGAVVMEMGPKRRKSLEGKFLSIF